MLQVQAAADVDYFLHIAAGSFDAGADRAPARRRAARLPLAIHHLGRPAPALRRDPGQPDHRRAGPEDRSGPRAPPGVSAHAGQHPRRARRPGAAGLDSDFRGHPAPVSLRGKGHHEIPRHRVRGPLGCLHAPQNRRSGRGPLGPASPGRHDHPRRLGHPARARQDRRRRGVRHDLRAGRGRLQSHRDELPELDGPAGGGRRRERDLSRPADEAVHRSRAAEGAVRGEPGLAEGADGRVGRRPELLPVHAPGR